MNKDLFPVVGLETVEEYDEKTGWPKILFKSISEQFITVLKWDVLNLNDELFWQLQSEKIITLLHNRIKFEDKIYRTEEDVVSFISRNFPSYTPQNKLDIVLEYLYKRTTFDGESRTFSVTEDLVIPQLWRYYYFNNANEFVFYLENLQSQGLIEWDAITDAEYHNLRITLNGLTKIIQIKELNNSNYCFVAMSFSKEFENVYDNGILPAIKHTGFEPLIIRKEHIDSDKTITDAIIAAIKKSRFTIADFTEHKAGVYFEAGYALGRGQKVIYTCREDDMGKAHFDTRNFQHIVWKQPEDLRQLLIDKIEAYILD